MTESKLVFEDLLSGPWTAEQCHCSGNIVIGISPLADIFCFYGWAPDDIPCLCLGIMLHENRHCTFKDQSSIPLKEG